MHCKLYSFIHIISENKEQAPTPSAPAIPAPLPPSSSSAQQPLRAPSRNTTPSPSSSANNNEPKSGVLLIRVCEARGITPPSNITLPAQQQVATSNRNNRDSLTRKQQNWWLPYVVLEFDKNEVLIDALGGDTANPIYQYRAHL